MLMLQKCRSGATPPSRDFIRFQFEAASGKVDLQATNPRQSPLFCNTVGTFVGMLLQYP